MAAMAHALHLLTEIKEHTMLHMGRCSSSNENGKSLVLHASCMLALQQVIAFEMEGIPYVAAVVRTRPAEDDPEFGLTHQIKYLSTSGKEWVKLDGGCVSDSYGHSSVYTYKAGTAACSLLREI